MNKKILVFSILMVFMLVSISFASEINIKSDETKKVSPLFQIRTKRSICEKFNELKEKINSFFIGKCMFFLPFNLLFDTNMLSLRSRIMGKTEGYMCISQMVPSQCLYCDPDDW